MFPLSIFSGDLGLLYGQRNCYIGSRTAGNLTPVFRDVQTVWEKWMQMRNEIVDYGEEKCHIAYPTFKKRLMKCV